MSAQPATSQQTDFRQPQDRLGLALDRLRRAADGCLRRSRRKLEHPELAGSRQRHRVPGGGPLGRWRAAQLAGDVALSGSSSFVLAEVGRARDRIIAVEPSVQVHHRHPANRTEVL